MTNIELSELNPAGSELFQDSENFLQELTEEEMEGIGGGLFDFNFDFDFKLTFFGNTIFTANTNTINANTIGNANSVIG